MQHNNSRTILALENVTFINNTANSPSHCKINGNWRVLFNHIRTQVPVHVTWQTTRVAV